MPQLKFFAYQIVGDQKIKKQSDSLEALIDYGFEVNPIFKGLPDIPKEYQAKIKIINKKPILASDKELQENSRSHSAKLRIIERV